MANTYRILAKQSYTLKNHNNIEGGKYATIEADEAEIKELVDKDIIELEEALKPASKPTAKKENN